MPYFGHFILHYILQLFDAGYKSYAIVFCIFHGVFGGSGRSRIIKNPLGHIPEGIVFFFIGFIYESYSSVAGASASSTGASASAGASATGASATGASASASATSEDFLSFLGIAFFGSSSSSNVSF